MICHEYNIYVYYCFEAEPSAKHRPQDHVTPQHGDVVRAVFTAAHRIEKHFTRKVIEVPAAHALRSDTLKHLYLKGAQSDICWLCGSGELSRVWYERPFKGHHPSSTEESACRSSAAVPTPKTSIKEWRQKFIERKSLLKCGRVRPTETVLSRVS